MANWYQKAKELMVSATAFSWVAGDYRVLLVKSSYSFVNTHDFVSTISGSELVATDYVRKALASKSVSRDDGAGKIRLIAADVVWTALGGAANDTIGGAVVYKFNASDAAAELIAFINTNDILTADNDITLDFDATNGLLTLT